MSNFSPAPLRVYAAGIVDCNQDWTWQGTVVAQTKSEARTLLAKFRKDLGIGGRCEVDDLGGPHFTSSRTKGVYYSTVLG